MVPRRLSLLVVTVCVLRLASASAGVATSHRLATCGEGAASSPGSAVASSSGGQLQQQATLFGDDGGPFAPRDRFGAAVAIDGDTAAIGAPYHDLRGDDTGAVFVLHRGPQGWSEEARLGASDGASRDAFGWSLGLTHDTLIVGARRDSHAGPDSGSAYLFLRDAEGWIERAKLIARDAARGDRFGGSVAVSGGTVLVGAELDDDRGQSSGSVYVFSGARGWTQDDKLLGRGTAAFDWFGLSVAIDADTVVVGAPADDHSGLEDAGAAYVFVRDGAGWLEQAVLRASDAGEGDQLGMSLVCADGRIAIGAWFDDDRAAAAGAVYVFARDGASWVEETKLYASDGAAGDFLGGSVAMSGDTLVAGAAGGSSAHVFVRETVGWREQQRLAVFPRPELDYWESAVAISGNTIVVGARADDAGSGAYVFVPDAGSWTQEARLTSPDPETDDFFGYRVGILGDTILVAAPLRDASGVLNSGCVFVYERDGGSWYSRAMLLPSEPVENGAFGLGLGLEDGTIVVGAPHRTLDAPAAGSVYVFARDGTSWVQTSRLVASGAGPGDQMGASAAVSAGTVVAGAWATDAAAGTPDVGAAYVFALPSPLVAAFTWTPYNPTPGERVQFTDTSTGEPGEWRWQFGDGVSAAAQHPEHAFVRAGRYSVTLTVDAAAGSDTGGHTITVSSVPPVAGFAWSPAYPAPGETVRFADTSIGEPAVWSWQLGDGSSSTEPSPEHAFAEAGTYTVSLAVANVLGDDTTSRQVEVSSAPAPDPELCFPAVARVPGSGAFFTSRIDLLNPATTPCDMDVVYTPRADMVGGTWRTVLTLLPRQLVEVSDRLQAWFGFGDTDSTVGSLMLRVRDGAARPLMQSVVFARNQDRSEYGQLFPAIPSRDALQPGTPAYLSTTVDACTSRVNVGVMALDGGTRVTVAAVDPIGTPLANAAPLDLAAGVSQQLNDIHRLFGLGDRDDLLLEVNVTAGRGCTS